MIQSAGTHAAICEKIVEDKNYYSAVLYILWLKTKSFLMVYRKLMQFIASATINTLSSVIPLD